MPCFALGRYCIQGPKCGAGPVCEVRWRKRRHFPSETFSTHPASHPVSFPALATPRSRPRRTPVPLNSGPDTPPTADRPTQLVALTGGPLHPSPLADRAGGRSVHCTLEVPPVLARACVWRRRRTEEEVEDCRGSVGRVPGPFEVGIALDVKPKSVKLISQKDDVEIVWDTEDEHVTVYDLAWLRHHSYDPPLKATTEIPKLMSVPHVQIRISVAVSFIDDLYHQDTERLARRICFVRESHYGGFWDFTANLAHHDLAYTTYRLGAHTDTTYFTDPVG
ncbi:MAG: hypothetical protein BJ554DRAFT_6010 [Olpidium bornovanus]|uniref:Trimethyllysine dioxygenase n=1 Tax=Olpidium bornovanus TaxID=278681 RepID=A0A8H7ZYG7_9FUNG|nr:MAG: hypothetical protein BJ554DRAFT_6010 [Olpidium bornovanus]